MVHWPLITGGLGAVLIVTGSILGFVVFPSVVRNQVIDNVVLRDGTEQFERWQELPQALDFKVYVFNVLNPDEVQAGAKPRVQEVGPYVYSQYRVKNDVVFSDDQKTVSYTQQQRYVFNARASAPLTEDDSITVLNMHVNSILQIIEKRLKSSFSTFRKNIDRTLDRTPIISTIKRLLERTTPIQSILQVIEQDPQLGPFLALINLQLPAIFGPTESMFIRTTPRQFLFDGVPFCQGDNELAIVICGEIAAQNSATIRKMEDGSLRFSFFHHKNATHDGEYEIETGVRDISDILQINKWKLNSTLSQWKNDESGKTSKCNMLNGTDGSALAPFQEPSGAAYIFSADICRSVEIHFDQPITYAGIPGLRFVTRDNFLNEIGPEFGTECFCTNLIGHPIARPDGSGCLHRGALDLSSCLGAPVVLTLPHFLGAADEYTSLVDGLQPDAEKHRIFLDVESHTGAPLRGGKRAQFNMFLRPIDHISITAGLTNTLFPVIWIDEGIELNDEMVDMLNSSLINVLTILDVITWLLIGLGISMVVGSLVWHLYRRKQMAASNSVEPIYPSG